MTSDRILTLTPKDRQILIEVVGGLDDLDISIRIAPERRAEVADLRNRIAPFLDGKPFSAHFTGLVNI